MSIIEMLRKLQEEWRDKEPGWHEAYRCADQLQPIIDAMEAAQPSPPPSVVPRVEQAIREAAKTIAIWVNQGNPLDETGIIHLTGYLRYAIAPAISQAIEAARADEREKVSIKAAKIGHTTAFEYLGMQHTQRMYGWHDVEDALTQGSAAIRALGSENPNGD